MDKYVALFRLSLIQNLKDYKSLIGLNLFLLTCLVVFAHLWKVAAAKIGAAHLKPDQLIWYIALNEWILIAIPDIQTRMEQDLREGKLAYFLPRPISYLGAIFSEGLGQLTIHLFTLGIVSFLFTWWKVGTLPVSTLGLCVFLVLGIGAGVMGLIFQMVIGLSAFWFQEVSPINWIWEKCLFALGGLMLPLAAYPLWIQRAAHWTPFPAILGARSALAIEFSLPAVLHILLLLMLWSLIGLCLLQLLYRKGLRLINIEG